MHAKTRRLCRMLAGFHGDDDWDAKALRCYCAPRPCHGKMSVGPSCVAYWWREREIRFTEKIFRTP